MRKSILALCDKETAGYSQRDQEGKTLTVLETLGSIPQEARMQEFLLKNPVRPLPVFTKTNLRRFREQSLEMVKARGELDTTHGCAELWGPCFRATYKTLCLCLLQKVFGCVEPLDPN